MPRRSPMPERSASTRGFAGSDFKAATPAAVGIRSALSDALLRKPVSADTLDGALAHAVERRVREMSEPLGA